MILFFFSFSLVHHSHLRYQKKAYLPGLLSRVFTLSASSSILSFEHRTACKSSSIDLWQAARPVTNCCVVSREDSGVDSVERAEDDDRLPEFTLDVEPLEGDGVRDCE